MGRERVQWNNRRRHQRNSFVLGKPLSKADRQVDVYQEDDGNIEVPNWCVEADVAKERLADLETPIAEVLDERSKEIWSLWVRHLRAAAGTYFKTNAAEVWGIDADGYDVYVNTLLQAFAKPSLLTMARAVEANGLDFANGTVGWTDDEETICKLAGADHIRDVPWLRSSSQGNVAQEPPSVWDQLQRFQQQTGLSYLAANLVVDVVREQRRNA